MTLVLMSKTQVHVSLDADRYKQVLCSEKLMSKKVFFRPDHRLKHEETMRSFLCSETKGKPYLVFFATRYSLGKPPLSFFAVN